MVSHLTENRGNLKIKFTPIPYRGTRKTPPKPTKIVCRKAAKLITVEGQSHPEKRHDTG